MAVHFVYRSHEVGPTLKHIKHFDDDNVLAWFQRIWLPMNDVQSAAEYVRSLLGVNLFAFVQWLMNTPSDGRSPPAQMSEVVRRFCAVLTADDQMEQYPSGLSVGIQDDEFPASFFVFDDEHSKVFPGGTDYLLWEPWQLPDASGNGLDSPRTWVMQIGQASSGVGAVYMVFARPHPILDHSHQIKGIRLPTLCRYLAEQRKSAYWPDELNELAQCLWGAKRGALPGMDEGFVQEICSDPKEDANWGAYSDWRTERDLSPPDLFLLDQALRQVEPFGFEEEHDCSRDLVHVSDHIAQLSLHVGGNTFHRWVIFDDCWVSANRTLADGLIQFAGAWDALGGKLAIPF